jgi:putative MFS transporter
LPRRQEAIFLLVGMSIVFSGYDINVFSLALPQIQRELHIPENAAGLTVSYFRLAALAALFVAPLADLFGRRRLLLVTVLAEAIFSLASGLTQNYPQFVAAQILVRVFGYAEQLLCFVVIAEEIDPRVRGWSTGTLAAMGATGAGLAALVFATIEILPFGWRALYVVGGGALLFLSYFRRWLPETARFAVRRTEIEALHSKSLAALDTLHRLVKDYPARLSVLLLAVGSTGFAVAPALILMSKFLQETHHYRPASVTLLFVGGGLFSVGANIVAGRISDRLGRRGVLMAALMLTGISFATLFRARAEWIIPEAWMFAVFAFLASDALLTGYPAEIFPTAYRATATTLCYVVSTLAGAASLALEGIFYGWFGAHGPAVLVPLTSLPVAVLAVYALPEPARRMLEEMA